MPVPSDYAIIGTVLALSVAILLLAGLALYVAFRVRETLRDEKGKGARAAKVAFLIGLLFLSGGAFYYFAPGFNPPGGATSSTVGQTSSTSTSALASSSTTSEATSTTGSATSSSATQLPQSVSMPAPSCAGSRVTASSTFACSIEIYDQGSTSYTGGTVLSGGDFSKFTIEGCTESVNGGPSQQVATASDSISVGSISPGSTTLTCSIQAPSQSGQDSGSVLTLDAVGFSQTVSVTFSIQVTA